MKLYKSLKQNARLALRENWGRAIGVLLIVLGINGVLILLRQLVLHSFVTVPIRESPAMDLFSVLEQWASMAPLEMGILGAFSLVGLLLVTPIQVGVMRWFWMLVHGRSLPISSIFGFFESGKGYWQAVWYMVSLTLRTLGWAILFYAVPSVVCGVSVWYLQPVDGVISRSTVAIATLGLMLSLVLLILATVLYFVYMEKYALTLFLLFESSEVKVSIAIKTSVAYMQGYRVSYFLFGLTFLGWAVLTPFTFGLLYLFLGPYLNTSLAMYGRYIIEKSRFVPDATKEFTVGQPMEGQQV